MSKRNLTIAIIVIVFSMMIACSGKHPSNLVGTWEKTEGDSSWDRVIVLASDGTGSKTHGFWSDFWMQDNSLIQSTREPLTWRVEKKRLYVFSTMDDVYKYKVSQSELRLTVGTAIATYKKQR